VDLAALTRFPRLAAVRRVSLVTILLLLAACRPEGASRAAAGTDGGTLVIVVPGSADNLLPPVTHSQIGAHVTERIFPRLADLKLDLNTVDDSGFTPVVARSWTHRDSTTIVFSLDPRARWQDGTPITADDVVYTFGVYRDPRTQSQFRVNLEPIASVTRVDSLTVAFAFHRWYPEQLYDATYHMRLLPKHLLDTIPDERLAASAFATSPVGAGPFRFVKWDEGAEIVVEADTTWFPGRPHLSRIVWRTVPDVPAAVTALIAGEADAMEFIPLPDEIARVKKAGDLRLVPYPSPFLGGVLFNLRRPLLADRATRRALAMAVDRATIVQSIFGEYGEVPVGAASRMQWITRGTIRQLPYDTAAAARALDSLGWRRGSDGLRRRGGRPLALTLITPTTSRIRQDASVHLQDQLLKAGVTVRIQPLEFSVFDARMQAGDFDAAMFSRTLDPSPANLVQFWGSAAVGGDNAGAYRSPAFDALLARAASAGTRSAAEPLYHQALEMLNDDAPAIFLYSPRNNAAIHTRFQDVSIRPDSWLATVAAWSVAPDRRLPRDR
jgi:peptide/nickel transport system substrate-binding protein